MKNTVPPPIIRPLRRLVADIRTRPITIFACLASVVAVSLSQTPQPGEVHMRNDTLWLASNQVAEPTILDAVPSPQCGDTITTNVRLRTDLTCLGDGLIVGADNVAIDLGGHIIMADPASVPDSVGIEDVAGHRSVTIRNGTIRNFAVGVRLVGSQATNLVNLQVLAIQGGELGGSMGTGLELSDTAGVTVRGGRIVINNLATEISASGDGLLISGMEIRGNNPTPVGGVVSLSGDVTIEDSTLSDVAVDWTGRLVVEHSKLTDSSIETTDIPIGQTGLFTAEFTGNTFSGGACVCHSGYTAFGALTILGKSNMEIAGIHISGNKFDGAPAAGVFIQTPGGRVTDVVISENTFSNNGHANYYYWPLRDTNGSPVNDGLHITASPGTAITIANNHTSDNANYGIEAQPGTVIDGGGNASFNDPSGCLGVICSGH